MTLRSELTRQIVWNRLVNVVEEQAMTLLRTAFSPIVRECGDLSAGVFDTKGRMLAQAVTGTPGHVNSMARSVGHFLRHFPLETMKPGDVYITNDPWMGTGHLNDAVLVSPAFHKGRAVGLFACTSHIVDIGGIGLGPDGRDVFYEGLAIPMLKLADEGRMNETILAFVRANSRAPIEAEGDIYSLAACNDIGVERLDALMTELGLSEIDTIGADILDTSEAAVRAAIRELPEGVYDNSMRVDGYDAPIDLVATLTIADGAVTVDYTGTSTQSRYGINVPATYCEAYTVFGLACVIAPSVPNNHGSLTPYTVSAPAGTILNAERPAPVDDRQVTRQKLADLVLGFLAQAEAAPLTADGASG
ncbi:MAG: hydantoinase B/oxoprolinase family protein, partial [Geminicoccaceae bacterium]